MTNHEVTTALTNEPVPDLTDVPDAELLAQADTVLPDYLTGCYDALAQEEEVE